MAIDIRQGDVNPEAVDRYLDAAAAPSQGHRPQWLAALRDGLGHRPTPITAWRDGELVGYLPLVATRSVLFGRRLVSLPYVSEAGVLAEDAKVAQALVNQAKAVGRKQHANNVELRHREPFNADHLNPTRRNKVGMTLGLGEDDEAMWSAIPSKVRNLIRKAEKVGVTTRVGGVEWLDPFFRIFARNVRDLGTPVLPKRLFRSILHHFGDDAELVVAEYDGRIVAAALLIHGRGVTEVPTASSLRPFNFTNANMALYWRLLSRSIERGSHTFDFGRSTEDSGPHRFKKQWKAEPHRLGWQRIDIASNSRSVCREDERFSLAIKAWQRMPIWMTRGLGPMISRSLC